jgi:HIRAN domain
MIFGQRDANLQWAKPRWRRIAVYGPVNFELEFSPETAARARPSFLGAPDASMRVVLRHEPTPRDRHAVTLYAANGRRIGALCPEIAIWVAPLLDSETTAFEGEIWPLDAGGVERGQLAPDWTMTLIRHELSPVAESPRGVSLLGAVRLAR